MSHNPNYYDHLLYTCLFNFSVHHWCAYSDYCPKLTEETPFECSLMFAMDNYDSFDEFCLESEHQCHFDLTVLEKTLFETQTGGFLTD